MSATFTFNFTAAVAAASPECVARTSITCWPPNWLLKKVFMINESFKSCVKLSTCICIHIFIFISKVFSWLWRSHKESFFYYSSKQTVNNDNRVRRNFFSNKP